jgi:hypothetical protein
MIAQTCLTDWRNKMKILSVLVVGLFVNIPVFAAKGKMTADEAKTATAKECQAKFKETQGKSADEIMEWVETEERGTNAKTFKKSKCYAMHEKWEALANKHEAGEEHEHKD